MTLVIFIMLLSSCVKGKTYVKLFYIDQTGNLLGYESREVIKSSDKTEQVKNIIEELLLGNVSPGLKNQFNVNSKLLGVVLDGNAVRLNFNRETFDDSMKPELIIHSIVSTLYFYNNNFQNIFFSIENTEYSYIGAYGPVNEGVGFNKNYLSR